MKYHVAKAATLSFPDGTKTELMPGVHDSKTFSDAEKNHWAFGAYVKPLDEADLLKEQEASNNAARVALLDTENTDLKAQLESRDESVGKLTDEVLALKAQLESRDESVGKLTDEVLALKAQLGEKDRTIEALNSELVAVKELVAEKDQKNGKKQ